MQIHLSESQIQEFSKQLAETCGECNLSDAEKIIRAAAINAVNAYRKWLQSDTGMD